MRSSDNNILIKEILALLTNIDVAKAIEIIESKDKISLFKYINKEFLDISEYKYLLTDIKFNKADIIEILYQIIIAINKNEKTKNKDTFFKTKELINNATKLGFTWPDSNSCFLKVEEEYRELKKALKNNNNNNIKEELGDLLFTLQCYADLKDYNITSILKSTNLKFEKRFSKLKEIAKSENIDLKKASSKVKEQLWEKAKKKV